MKQSSNQDPGEHLQQQITGGGGDTHTCKKKIQYKLAQSRGHHIIDRQSDEHWNSFKGDVGETSERRGGAHMGFSERTDKAYRLELN